MLWEPDDPSQEFLLAIVEGYSLYRWYAHPILVPILVGGLPAEIGLIEKWYAKPR